VKIQVLQENLARGLSIIARAVSSSSTLPVLQNILITTDQGRLKLAATNLEIGIICWLGAKIEAEGAITVPAKTLEDLVKTLPGEAVGLSLDTATQTLAVHCGKSRTKIKGIDAQEFPPMPNASDAPGVTINVAEFKEAVSAVIPAASEDEARPVLTGAHLVINNSMMSMDTADGFRLTRFQCPLKCAITKPVDMIVPAKALEYLARILDGEGQLTISVSSVGNQVFFEHPNVRLITQRIEGAYPDLEQVIPKSHKTRTTLPTAALLKACKQADIFAREDGHHIMRFELAPNNGAPGSVKVSAQADTGNIETTLDGDIQGIPLLIGFNAQLMREILGTIKTSNVAVETSSEREPAVFLPVGDHGSLLHVLMPMHLGD
jgi:DNA polymerase-3 subunit beta